MREQDLGGKINDTEACDRKEQMEHEPWNEWKNWMNAKLLMKRFGNDANMIKSKQKK